MLARKKRRGPPPTGKGTQVVTRLHADLLGPLDEFINDQADKPTRPEAIRRLLRDALTQLGFMQPPKAKGEDG